MSEATPKPSLLLDEIVGAARTVTLADGYHLPTVIADGSQQSIVARLDQLAPTHEARAQQLWVLGAVLAERGELGVLQQVFLITEAWLSMGTPEQPPRTPPSQDPQRQEILSIARLVLLPRQTELVILAMKRNHAGKLIGLPELNRQIGGQQETVVESPLLEAFVIGFLSSKVSPDD